MNDDRQARNGRRRIGRRVRPGLGNATARPSASLPGKRALLISGALVVVLVLWGLALRGRLFGSSGAEVAMPPAPSSAASAAPAAGGFVHLFVQPEAGRGPILDEIAGARRSITLQVYLLSDEATIAALEAAAHRGVSVRVLLEEHPFGGAGGEEAVFERLEAAAIAVRWGNPVFRFSHVKTMVIDGEAALVMNQNLTRSAFEQNRELNVLTTRPADVAQAAAIFTADWSSGAEPPAGPLVVSPTTSRRTLLALIGEAERSLDLYAEVVRDREMIEALVAAAQRGVRVRLVATGGGDDDQAEERAELAAAGVAVRLTSSPYIHAKLILVDGRWAFVGSQNLTATSLDQNRELGILLDDPVAVRRAAETFAADFAAAADVPPDEGGTG